MKKFVAFIISLCLAFAVLLGAAQTVSAGPAPQEDIIARGKYIAQIAGCIDCHSPYKEEYNQPPQDWSMEQLQIIAFDGAKAADPDKLLAGGRPFDLGPLGVVFTKNITPDEATGIGSWSEEQIKIAIKTGLDKDGKTLFPVMPYHVFNGMADDDLNAVVVYIKSVAPVENQVPKSTVSTEGMPTLPYELGITAPDPADKGARGAYLVNHVMGCTDCHTPVDPNTGAPLMDKYLAGRQPYEGPWGIVYGGNITPDKETGIGSWTDEEVKRAIVAGIGKDGRRLILMPWYAYSALTPEDADAVVFFLKNGLTPVKNQIPAASLNPAFNVMAPEAESTSLLGNLAASPIILVVAGVLVIVLFSLVNMALRRKQG